ncbi:MAG: hypothetical protein ACRD0E_03960 [Acidimicrobiales bacterium]
MSALPRLRQVALAVNDCATVSRQLQEAFGWGEPFHDPGVGAFGLSNSVFAAGDTFVEVVSPERPETTAGRYIERRGGDSGYMAIFQVADLSVTRQRVAAAGVRVVWSSDHADIAGTHLHPKDVPGAIVSLDWAEPPESWRWAGPAWTGRAAPHDSGGVAGLTIEVNDPQVAAERWAIVLGLSAAVSDAGSATIALGQAGQELRFEPALSRRGEGITEVHMVGMTTPVVEIAGVRFLKKEG